MGTGRARGGGSPLIPGGPVPGLTRAARSWLEREQVPAPLVAEAIARFRADCGLDHRLDPDPCPGGPEHPPAPETGGLGRWYEQQVDPAVRHLHGIHYTPPEVAADLVARAVAAGADASSVLDPACGSGSFLIAAAERRWVDGSPPEVFAQGLYGMDTDPVAVAICRLGLGLAGWRATGEWPEIPGLRCADALTPAWPADLDGVSLVVTNPPFGSQLRGDTVHSSGRRSELDSALGPVVGAYTDVSSLFLVRSVLAVRPGGQVVIIMPRSVLSARDSGPIRRQVAASAELVEIDDAPISFDASVSACALRFAVGHAGGEEWSDTAATLNGLPRVATGGRGTFADMVVTSADFRDEYYALAGAVRESPSGVVNEGMLALVTSGLIDPLHNRWGRDPARFAKETWDAPVVDPSELRSDWIRARSAPKLLVASQTSTLECVVDPHGRMIGSTPVVHVRCDPGDLWLAAAVVAGPVATLFAARSAHGSGMSPGALRVSSALVAGIPLPAHRGPWHEAAALLERSDAGALGADQVGPTALRELGNLMAAAYGMGPELVEWWWNRLPNRALGHVPS